MRKAAWLFLLPVVLVPGCDSNSPTAPTLEKAVLVAEWSGTISSVVLEWDNFSTGGMETHVLTDLNWRMTIEDASYSLEASSYSASKYYEADQWGFWEITDAAAGTVRFSPQQENKLFVQEFRGSMARYQVSGGGVRWTGKAMVGGSTLLLTEIPKLFRLQADSLSLSRRVE